MRRFRHGAKDAYEGCAASNKEGADKGVFSEGLAEDHGGADGVEDEAGLWIDSVSTGVLLHGYGRVDIAYRLES